VALLEKAKNDAGKKDKPADDKKPVEDKAKHKKPVKHAAPPKASAQQADSQADADGGDEQDSGPEANDQQAPSESQDSAAPAGGDDGEQQDDGQAGGGAAQPEEAQDGQQGGQNAQGGSPVPDPNAPGAGISTGEDTADDDSDANAGPAGAQSAMGGPQSASTANVPLSPSLKEAYQSLDKELVETLYQKGAAEHLLPALYAQGPDKIKSIVTVSVMLAKAIFTKQKAPLPLALPFARDTAAHVMQIGEQVKQIQYSDQECTAVFGAVYEGMLRAFGVTKQQFTHAQHMMPKSQMSKHAQAYVSAHQHAMGAIEKNNTTPHADHAGPAGPPAQAAGPQGPQGAPQGGMLAQGAQQSGGAPEGSPQEEAAESPQEEAQEQANG